MIEFEKIDGISGSDYAMNVVKTPACQEYSYVSLKKYDLADCTYYHGYITASEIATKKLPLDANPRLPTSGSVTKKMVATLCDSPGDFHHLNNGITLVAKSVEMNEEERTVRISFGKRAGESGYGICNGGHTYFAIETLQATIEKTALVRVEILVLPEELSEPARLSKIKRIAAARNNHNQLKTTTEANYSGSYEAFKTVLGKYASEIRWKEGDRAAREKPLPSDKFIALMASISPHWFRHPLVAGPDGDHLKCARGVGGVHSQWLVAAEKKKPSNLFDVLPLSVDVLRIRDMIAASLRNDDYSNVKKVWRRTRLFQSVYNDSKTRELTLGNTDEVEGLDIPFPHMAMIVGSFRSNVWYAEVDNDDLDGHLIGWFENPRELWAQGRQDLILHFHSLVAEVNQDKVRDYLARAKAAYAYNAQLSNLVHGMKVDRERLDKPWKFYYNNGNYSDVDEYLLCEPKDAEYQLKTDWDEDSKVLFVEIQEFDPSAGNTFGYRMT